MSDISDRIVNGYQSRRDRSKTRERRTELQEMGRFQSVEASSVMTKRNFGLSRGRTGSVTVEMLRTASVDLATLRQEEEEKEKKKEEAAKQLQRRSSAASLREGNFADRCSQVWLWPLGDVEISNGEESFEATFDYRPFSSKDVSAKVMGAELMIMCKSEPKKDEPINYWSQRELFRTYQLPLNVDSSSVRFRLKPDEGKLLFTAKKIPPLQMQGAFYQGTIEEENS